MTSNKNMLLGAAGLFASLLVAGCADPEPQVRSMEVIGRVIAPPAMQGPVEVRLYHAWSLEGDLRHPLQWIDTFDAEAGSTFQHSFDYPTEIGEGLVVYAWMDTDGDGVLCTPTSRQDISGLTEAEDASAASVEVEVMLVEPCRGPDFFFPPAP